MTLIVNLNSLCRTWMALDQPGYPDVYRVFRDPQGDGGPCLQDPVSESGQSGDLRPAGRSDLSANKLILHQSVLFSEQVELVQSSNLLRKPHVKILFTFLFLHMFNNKQITTRKSDTDHLCSKRVS